MKHNAAGLLFATMLIAVAAGCTQDNTAIEPGGPAPAIENPASATDTNATDTNAFKGFSIVTHAPADGELAALLEAEAAKAKELGQKPFVEFSAGWCPPCQALKKSLDSARSNADNPGPDDAAMLDAFHGVYIIQLDADAWKGKLGSTGLSQTPIPVFFEIDEQGKVTGRKITGGAWGEDIPSNMAPPLKAFFQG